MASLGNSVATDNQTDLEKAAHEDLVGAGINEVSTDEQAASAAALVRNPHIGEIRERLARESRHSVSSRNDAIAHPPLRAPRVSLVIPARNEALNLPLVFENIPEDIYEIIVVDGDSTDGTADVALALRDNVRVVGQDRPGKGNALMSGFVACRGDIIVTIDADASMDAGEIPLYVDALTSGADFVRGSRFMENAGTTDITPIRKVGAHGLRILVNVLFGTRYTDLLYGYCGFWRSSLYELAPDCDGFEFEAKMNLRAHTLGRTVVEVPTMEVERAHGDSNLNAIRDGLRILRVILAERLTPARRRVAKSAVEPAELSATIQAATSNRRRRYRIRRTIRLCNAPRARSRLQVPADIRRSHRSWNKPLARHAHLPGRFPCRCCSITR
jgi:glycosyltransferase involved in cell wall biosynthesis